MGFIENAWNSWKVKIKNLGIRKSLSIYILMGMITAILVSVVTICFFEKWKYIVLSVNGISLDINTTFLGTSVVSTGGVSQEVGQQILVLNWLEMVSIFCILVVTIVLTSQLFYKRKFKETLAILQKEMQFISRDDLSFDCSYITDDEMGKVCLGFNQMRLQLIENRKNLWDLMEGQRELNAAFAHDIRTPLTVMKGYTQMVLKYYQSGQISEDKLLETLRMIDNQVDRMERFSATMKEIHSFEEFQPDKNYILLKELVEKLENNAKGMARDKIQIFVKYEKLQDLQKEIYCDSGLIQEVVDNLLFNGSRFAKTKVTIEMVMEEDKFLVFIKDDGEGFSSEALEKGMRPYFSTDKNHFGLGLAISKMLTKKHGGNLELMNAMDGGAIACGYFYVL